MRGLVIVRAFSGEPLRRVALFADTDAVYTASVFAVEAGLGYPPPTAVPRRDAYRWDAASYARLKAQWREQGGTDADGWSGLAPFSGHCLDASARAPATAGGGVAVPEGMAPRQGVLAEPEMRVPSSFPPTRRIGHASACVRIGLARSRIRPGTRTAGATPL